MQTDVLTTDSAY